MVVGELMVASGEDQRWLHTLKIPRIPKTLCVRVYFCFHIGSESNLLVSFCLKLFDWVLPGHFREDPLATNCRSICCNC